MKNYKDYIDEMRSAVVFRDIAENDLLALLDKFGFEIVKIKAGEPRPPMPRNGFQILLRTYPAVENTKTRFAYDMPDFGACGFLMGEIPSFSRLFEGFKTARPKPPFAIKPPEHDMDVLVVDIAKLCEYQGDDVGKAQMQLWRNLTGMVAQKVNDVRQELFKLRDGFDMYAEPDPAKHLNVLTAGVAGKVVADTVDKWNAAHPELPAVVRMGGSVDLARAVLAGDPCDVIVSADDALFDNVLRPDYIKSYTVFAGNKMVIAATGGNKISSADWKEKLLADDAVFAHFNPYNDPGGYRAVMCIQLADKVEKGLTDKLMNHKGHRGMERGHGKPDDAKYTFTYYSGAVNRKLPFAELPAVMDLSDEKYAAYYADAEFTVDGGYTVKGAPIAHAVAVPAKALHPEEARQFVKTFLDADFGKYGFITREQVTR